MKFELTDHAQTVVSQRHIRFDWLERVVSNPGRTEPDERDSQLEHRLGMIQEYGGRVLRVVVKKSTEPVEVVTAYFDRGMRNKL